jgi:hypothetical protein
MRTPSTGQDGKLLILALLPQVVRLARARPGMKWAERPPILVKKQAVLTVSVATF